MTSTRFVPRLARACSASLLVATMSTLALIADPNTMCEKASIVQANTCAECKDALPNMRIVETKAEGES